MENYLEKKGTMKGLHVLFQILMSECAPVFVKCQYLHKINIIQVLVLTSD